MSSAADIRSAGAPRTHTSESSPPLDENNCVAGYGEKAGLPVESIEAALRTRNAALKQQRRLYEAILTNTPDLAYVFDLDHRFIYANEGLLKMWGKTWEEAIGKNCLELGYEPWHAAMHDREIEQVIATREPVRGEVPFMGTFGRRIYDYIFVPVIGPEGEVEAVAGTTRDVTEYKRKAEALRKSEEHLSAELEATRQLQAISTQLVHERDTQALYDKIIDAAVSIMRSDFASMQMYHPGRGEKGELQLLAFRGFDPEAAKFWEWVRADSGCTCGEALRTSRRAVAENVESCEFMAGTDDRTAYLQAGMYAAQSTPLFSRSGRLLGMLSTHWREPHHPTETDLQRFDILARQAADLIERVNADIALRQSEARHRHLVEQTVDGIFVATTDGHYVDVNPAGCEMLRMTREEVLASTFTDVLVAEEHHRIPAEVARLDEGVITRGEWRFRRKDGSVFVGELIGRRLPDGRLQGIVRDTTDRKLAEEKLRATSAQLRQVLETADTGLTHCSRDLRYLSANPAYAKIAGVPVDQIVGRAIVDVIGEEALALIRPYVERVLQGERVEYEGELPWKARGRSLIGVIYTPVFDDGGNVTGWVASITDITERKQAEERLKKSEADLRLRNAELARFNQAMIDREIRMIELKKEINILCAKLGESARYPLEFERDGRKPHG